MDFSNSLDALSKYGFDVVVCAGVLYNMLNPFDSTLKCRALLKRGGILDPTLPEVPPETPLSEAWFTGTPGDKDIDRATYEPDSFPHPGKDFPSLGSTVWMNKNHNF